MSLEVMEGYALCTDCEAETAHGVRPIEDFYVYHGRPHRYCKHHTKVRSLELRSKKSETRKSQKAVEDAFRQQGIHLTKNQRTRGLHAWGCIPVEVHGARVAEDGRVVWYFTRRQRQQTNSRLLVFVAWHTDEEVDIFLVPSTESELFYRDGSLNRTGLTIAIDSDHHNARNWDWLRDYKDAFFIVENMRREFSEKLKMAGKQC